MRHCEATWDAGKGLPALKAWIWHVSIRLMNSQSPCAVGSCVECIFLNTEVQLYAFGSTAKSTPQTQSLNTSSHPTPSSTPFNTLLSTYQASPFMLSTHFLSTAFPSTQSAPYIMS